MRRPRGFLAVLCSLVAGALALLLMDSAPPSVALATPSAGAFGPLPPVLRPAALVTARPVPSQRLARAKTPAPVTTAEPELPENALPIVPPAALGAVAGAALVVLTDRGDKAVREQAARLAGVLAAWPLRSAPLMLCARGFSLAPALAVLAVHVMLAGQGAVVRIWQGVALAACCAIVTLPLGPRGRVVLVVLACVVLAAIGSEFGTEFGRRH